MDHRARVPTSHGPRVRSPSFFLLTLALLAVSPESHTRADEEPGGLVESPGAGPTPVRAATDEEARALVQAIDAAARAREPDAALAALERLEGICHSSFPAPLAKLLAHRSPAVAARAAVLLGQQTLLEEREREKVAKDLWKRGFAHPANDDRLLVRGQVLRAMATLNPVPLGARDLNQVEKLWRQGLGNPSKEIAPFFADVLAYVRATKDKRCFRLVAEQLDEPMATDVSSPTNPPASWWEARWHLWNEMKGGVAATLTALTGQVFKDSAAAREWAKAQGPRSGYDW
jgi:hypothetical protein